MKTMRFSRIKCLFHGGEKVDSYQIMSKIINFKRRIAWITKHRQ